MSKPTVRASIESAMLGLGQLKTALETMTDEEADEILVVDEVAEIDTAVWEMLEMVEDD